MKKEIIFSGKGHRADIGDMMIYRILPNHEIRAVGPFVFLDYLAPQGNTKTGKNPGTGAHPHRGIATLSYILHGVDTHYDSAGHFARVSAGGIQWMKAGKGIIHDETLVVDQATDAGFTQGFQFWINLPGKQKNEHPDYMAIQADEVPLIHLEKEAGWIKIIAGSYEGRSSRIPSYTKQFLYHIHLCPEREYTLDTDPRLQYALYIPESEVQVNDTDVSPGDFISFAETRGIIEITNEKDAPADILIFGGAPYTEPIVAEGPFVMNAQEQIVEAYRDFHLGKYGRIDYGQGR